MVCQQITKMGATSGAGTAYPSGAPQFTPNFQWGSQYSIFSFMCMFCRSLFVLLSLLWPLCCLSFDLRILITPLVSSNSSYTCICFIITSYLLQQVTCLGLTATLWEPNDAAEVLAVQGALNGQYVCISIMFSFNIHLQLIIHHGSVQHMVCYYIIVSIWTMYQGIMGKRCHLSRCKSIYNM